MSAVPFGLKYNVLHVFIFNADGLEQQSTIKVDDKHIELTRYGAELCPGTIYFWQEESGDFIVVYPHVEKVLVPA